MAIFLQLDGIESDATETTHQGWIPCASMSLGTSRPMYLETGKGMQRETSNAELEEIALTMKMNKGSPKVFLAALAGRARKATLHVTRTAEASGAANYLEI